jgi:hypothetical protein
VRIPLLLLSVWTALSAGSALAQGFGETTTKGPRPDKSTIQKIEIGLTVTAAGGPCKGILGTAPVPLEWPEQLVKIDKEDFSPSVKNVNYRMVNGTCKQMVVNMPLVAAGEECRALTTFEITRYALLPPADTTIFVMPNTKKMKSSVRWNLGPSPMIESNQGKIRAIAKELAAENKDKPAWQRVEAIYDWVRAHVEYINCPLKGALQALKDGNGDAEDLTSLFIAVCRASDIPARTVWLTGHCYPEFYLEDGEGVGYWIPCQAAGNKEFGGISDMRPILAKGDNFQVPERRERQRFVPEHLTGAGGQPQVRFIRNVTDAGG